MKRPYSTSVLRGPSTKKRRHVIRDKNHETKTVDSNDVCEGNGIGVPTEAIHEGVGT